MLQRLLEGTGKGLQDLSENMFKKTIELGEVLFCLSTLRLDKKEVWTMPKIEASIKSHLEVYEYEQISLQHLVVEKLRLSINIDVGAELGIFCCEAKELVGKKIMQVLGKIQLLQHLAYSGKFIVVIVGKKRSETNSGVQLLQAILEEQEVTFLFMRTN